MILQEPKVEFVAIDFKGAINTTVSSGCDPWKGESGGTQRCFASQEMAMDCPDWETLIPFSGGNENE